jgi:hypothetical protein
MPYEQTDDAQAKELLAELEKKVDETRVLVHQPTTINLCPEHNYELAMLLDAMYQTSQK